MNHNSFEQSVIACEGMLDKAREALKSITDSDLFSGTGVVTNKYSDKKRYYPNISGIIKNAKTGVAVQEILNRLNVLSTPDVEDPSVDLNTLDAVRREIISDSYNVHFFAEDARYIDDLSRKLVKITSIYADPRDKVNIDASRGVVDTVLRHLDFSSARPRSGGRFIPAKPNLIRAGAMTDVIARIQTRSTPFRVKFELQNLHDILAERLDRAISIADDVDKGNIQLNHTTDLIQGISFGMKNVNGKLKIPRDSWNDFIDLISKHIGYQQTGYTDGATVIDILTGVARAEKQYTRGTRSLLDKKYKGFSALSPELLKDFHNQIMMPLFINIKKPVFLYLERDQWEKLSSGSSIYRAATGLGKQIYKAGSSMPTVRL